MSTQRGFVKKFIIIFILALMLISMASMFLMYLVPSSKTGSGTLETGTDIQSGVIVETGIEIATGDTGESLPTLTKEEASKELQNMLSGLSTSGMNK